MAPMLSDDQPIFNLKAVVQETGVKPDTLRAWERRYGLPLPQRTEGHHRLYSRRDIRTIQWLLAQRDAGLSISQAVELWNELEESKKQGQQVHPYPNEAAATLDEEDGHMAALRQRWIMSALAFDDGDARQALSDAFAVFPVELVCSQLLLPALREIGQGWYTGEATVQQEHFATGLATRQLEALTSATPLPSHRGRILTACPPDEDHVFPLLMLTVFMRRRGWDVVHLGANVPIDRFQDTVQNGDFSLVASSAQQLHTAATLMELATILANAGVPLAYGGRIFNVVPELRTRIPGVFLGERIENAPLTLEHVIVAQPSPAPLAQRPAKLVDVRKRYQQQLSAIEGTVEDALGGSDIAGTQFHIAHRMLANELLAALALGDLAYLDNEIEWIRGLLSNRNLPDTLLDRYLGVYAQALQLHLGGHADPITKWLLQAQTSQSSPKQI